MNIAFALVAGALITWLILRTKLTVAFATLSIREQSLGVAETALGEQQRISNELRTDLASLKTELENEKRVSAEKLELLATAKSEMESTFKALASDALQNNNQSFLTLAKTRLETFQTEAQSDLEARKIAIASLVSPISESLLKVDGQLKELENKRLDAYVGLKTQVDSLLETQTGLRDETANLVQALRSPSVRGRWGEFRLRRVVELAGMLSYCDFVEQQSVNTDDGRLRPDLVVKLPGSKQVIVDSKTPLDAYLDSIECRDEGQRRKCLQKHASQVRAHMTKLSAKSYWEQFDASPEFVVMFLPGETFFSAALEQDPSLLEEGVNQRVIIASPTTLIALLQAVAYGWRQERLAQNAEEISKLGKEMYERLRKMTEHFEVLGKGLNRAVDAYNSAASSLESRVLVSARRFTELGASASDEIPEPKQIESVTRTLALEWEEPEGSTASANDTKESLSDKASA
jgi:DNA recombination protein RmuC